MGVTEEKRPLQPELQGPFLFFEKLLFIPSIYFFKI